MVARKRMDADYDELSGSNAQDENDGETTSFAEWLSKRIGDTFSRNNDYRRKYISPPPPPARNRGWK